MGQWKIRDKCRVVTNRDTDVFVGIKCENGGINIHFPLGFEIPEDDRELRRDILLLLNTIRTTTARKDSEFFDGQKTYHDMQFPVQAYLAVIFDFYSRGYYKECEITYRSSKRGKIDWNRTIKTQKPYVQNGNAYYLDFITKKDMINKDELITWIHKFCVYESFLKIGWLFTSGIPEKPKLKYNAKLFRRVLREKIAGTFNDRNRTLFIHMLEIIDCCGTALTNKTFKYGTYRFEYVWEALIDRTYGISGKEAFFPKTYWNLNGQEYPNVSLEPDTIMIYNGAVYVLDAKYYKYGATRRVTDLPGSASVNKQITYGEYIAKQEKFREKFGEDIKVYNAFLMPFNSMDPGWKTKGKVIRIGEVYGDWKQDFRNRKFESYERVQGIVIDIKYLMKMSIRQNEEEIMKLAEKIEQFA